MLLYQLLIRLLSPLIWLLTAMDAVKRRGGRAFLLQRLGLSYPPLDKASDRIWIHCASVGEVKAAEPLIRELLDEYELLITTTTPTGKTVFEDLFAGRIEHRYCPLDWPFAVRRFLKACRPSELWVMETEIWPNLYRISQQTGLRIQILNARISFKTLKAPQWLKNAYRQTFTYVDQILARSDVEAARFISLGARPERIRVLGNLKYAQTEKPPANPRPIERTYILIASTHTDEELEITKLWLELQRPELLVIVPRHPIRSGAIQKQLESLNLRLKVASRGEKPDSATSVFLDDQLGKLMPLFEHAQVVVMGGSFAPKGGHNILEPAAYGSAIITGPDMRDFEEETALLLEHKGLIQCQGYADLKPALQNLLAHPEKANKLGSHALKALQAQQDILNRYLAALTHAKDP